MLNLLRLALEVRRPTWLGGTPRRWQKLPVMSVTKEKLMGLARFVDEGKLKPVVDSVFEFEDVQGAYERMMSNRALGKVVVRVADF